MAQTAPTRERGKPLSQQQTAPREAPRNNVPATRGAPQQQQAAGGSTRGMSQAQRGANAMQNFADVMARFVQELDAWSRGLYESGRSSAEVQFFKDVLQTAVSEKPELLYADRRTFYNSAKKCFLDGCLPDGRDAALVVYRTKVKVRDSEGIDVEASIDAVQYMPMVQGIRRKMLESGFVTYAFADAVYEKDNFRHVRGLHASIEHETPALGKDRGKLIGCYAIIKLSNGEVLLDSMGEKEVMAAKAQGRAGDSSLLWSKFPWEGYKKTVLRRLAKSAPVSPNIRRLVDREDEPFDGEVDESGKMRSSAPRFDQPTYTIIPDEPEPEAPLPTANGRQQALDQVTFDVTDTDGEVHSFGDPFKAFDAAWNAILAAGDIGVAVLDGFWESNLDLLDALSVSGNDNLGTELAQRYADARDKADARQAAAVEAGRREQEAERLRLEEAAAEEARANGQQEQGSGEGTGVAPEAEQGNGGASVAPAADEKPFPGDLPSKGQQNPDQPRDMPAPIPLPMKNGKPDYRTFAMALIRPKIRAAKATFELALLLAANEAHLDKCKAPGTLDAADRETLLSDIKGAFEKLTAAGA